MEKNKRKRARTARPWTCRPELLGGVAVAALLWGCLNTVSVPDWTSGTDQSSENSGSSNPGVSPSPAAPEFIVTLGIGAGEPEAEGPLVPSSRSVLGPGAGSIQYGGIRNIVQVIVVNAGTGDVTHFQQEVRNSDNDTGAVLTVQNTWPGQRYHILVLTGHRERNYAAEINPAVEYKYKADPPTLLAAGLLANREIQSGEKTLSITMQPLLVDTVFAYGGGTVDEALPFTEDGTALPAGVAASIVWTVTGGIATLRDAQAGLPGGGINLNWGNPFKSQHAILSLNGGAPTEASAALVDNRITLGLEKLAAGDKGSANFNLEYLPFGAGDMEVFKAFEPDPDKPTLASWILRNGVNDQAQNGKTLFPNASSTVSPWNDKDVSDPAAANGNGAVAFTFANPEITDSDLTEALPAPVTGAKPVTKIKEGRYTGDVVWTDTATGNAPEYFKGETVYAAAITDLKEEAGFYFSSDGVTVTHSGSSSISYGPDGQVGMFFLKTGAVWEYSGYFSGSSEAGGDMDSAIDIISSAKDEGWSSLSLQLFPWAETVDLAASGKDIGGGLELTATNSPAAVTLDGGGKTIPLTAGNTGSVITVGSGVTLTLRNITFKGSTTNKAPLIKVETGGTLVLEKGAVITGNTNTTSSNDTTIDTTDQGGGVFVNSGGTLNLEDGAYITDNNASSSGGGVYVKGIKDGTGGTFNMSGGEISGNKASTGAQPNGTGGGGVHVTFSTFIMSGGDIKDNESSKHGGGVSVGLKATFTMNGGTISGNTAIIYSGGSGGGVYVARGSGETGVFTKTSGTIYGNEDTVDKLSKNQANNAGHAVFVGSTGGKRDTTAGPEVEVDSADGTGLPD